jgi:uncharacterized RDD family membrane protein YckC
MQATQANVSDFSRAYKPAFVGDRFAAALIDGLVIALLGLLGGVPGILYILLKDGLFNGRSLGKKLLGIRVVDVNTGAPCSFKQSAIRHVGTLIPLVHVVYGIVECVMVIVQSDHRRFGDRWADTIVIEANDGRETEG